jgi:hypothetical protein
MVLQYNMRRIGNSAPAQAKDKHVKEATIVGSHHPPVVTVGVGVFVWCREMQGLDEVQGSFGLMYEQRWPLFHRRNRAYRATTDDVC